MTVGERQSFDFPSKHTKLSKDRVIHTYSGSGLVKENHTNAHS